LNGLFSILFNFMNYEMPAVAFLGLITRGRFPHSVVSRGAAVLSVSFDAVPFDLEIYPARIFVAGEKFTAMGSGLVGIF
jgi:hypothetical protein